MEKLVEAGTLSAAPIRDFVAAVSVGMVEGAILLDLCYEEDSQAEVDLNFVMTGGRKIVEVQATAEQHPFDETQLKQMMDFAARGIELLIAKQRSVLKSLPLRQ
jgi:ribonuclease PH